MHVGLTPSILDRVHAGIDDALRVDLDELDDRALREATVEVHRAEARLAAARSRLVAALDRRDAYAPTGAQSAAAYVASACRLPVGVARHHVVTARALAHLPATAERLADGDLNWRHASRLAACWSNPRTQEVAERDDETLSAEAARLPFRLFEKVVAYWQQRADPDGADDDAEAQRARRRLHVSRTLDGCFKLDGLLDPIDGTIVAAALRRIEDGLWEADRDEARRRLDRAPVEGDLARSAQQRRADALVDLARRATSSPADAQRPKPLVSVLVGYETFAGRVCELADGTVLAPGRVAALLDEAVIERAVFDGPARVLEIGRQRCFVGALRRAIELRDRTCTHVHCDRPADGCDVDHIEPWNAGGSTIQANGRILCPFHNHRRQRAPDGPSP